MKLPIIELKVNEESGAIVDFIALTSAPAIESNFLAFSDTKNKQKFAIDNARHEVLGAAMIPDLKIFRTSPSGNYFCFFSKDTIRDIAKTFLKNGFSKNINIEHDSDKIAEDTYVFQSYIVDSALGVMAPKGLDLPDGSWVVGMKVGDSAWNSITKDNEDGFVGFSIEGLFDAIDSKQTEELSKNSIDEDIKIAMLDYFNALNKIKT